jgi:hypothetical protein
MDDVIAGKILCWGDFKGAARKLRWRESSAAWKKSWGARKKSRGAGARETSEKI